MLKKKVKKIRNTEHKILKMQKSEKLEEINYKYVFFGLSSFQILAFFRRGIFYTYLSIYMRIFLGLGVTLTTLYATLPMLASVLAQGFIWGKLSDRLQKRRTLIIVGEFTAGILIPFVFLIHRIALDSYGNLISGLAIIFGLSIVEFFWSMSNLGWSAILSDLYGENERSKVMSRLNSVGALGRIIGVEVGAFFYDGFSSFYPGWGFHEGVLFYIVSAVIFISIIPLLILPEGGANSVSKERKAATNVSDINKSKIKPNNNVQIDERSSNIANASNTFIIFVISMAFINFGSNSIAIIFSQYVSLESGFGLNSRMLGHIANMRSIGIILFGLFSGSISQKIGHNKMLIISSTIMIISIFLIPIAVSVDLLFISMFLKGLAEVSITASSYTIASSLIEEENRGKYFAYYNATFFLSWGLASTLISGPTIDILMASGYGEVFAYKMAFYIGIILILIGLVIFINLIFQKKKQLSYCFSTTLRKNLD